MSEFVDRTMREFVSVGSSEWLDADCVQSSSTPWMHLGCVSDIALANTEHAKTRPSYTF